MARSGGAPWLVLLPILFPAVGWCQDNPYVYVKMPLTVPWALYFVFLGAVLIPFVLMIVLSWRKQPMDESRDNLPVRRHSSETDC